MKAHKEDDEEIVVWQGKMTLKYVTMADLWRWICKLTAEST